MVLHSTPLPSENVVSADLKRGKVIRLEKTYPQQLKLWQTFLPDDVDVDDYSNTVELYDAIPKYFSSKKKMAEMRASGKYLDTLERHFVHRGTRYNVTIKPGRIKDRDGVEREHYPSWREELVEEALKKIATAQYNGVYLNDTAGVQFTLYELRKELHSRGHSINFYDLLDSLSICHDSRMQLSCSDGKSDFQIASAIFPVLAIANRRDWERDPKKTRCYVQFHPLVTRSINTLAYRQFSYVLFMTFKRQLARWLHKRLSHNYVQASITEPYHIQMSTIIRDSALINRQERRHSMSYIDRSLDELVEKQILINYDKEITTGQRRRIDEVTYSMTPHPHFVGQVKKANKRASHLSSEARNVGLFDNTTRLHSLDS